MTTTVEALAALGITWMLFYLAMGPLLRYLSPRRARVRAAAKAENEAIRRASATLWGADK